MEELKGGSKPDQSAPLMGLSQKQEAWAATHKPDLLVASESAKSEVEQCVIDRKIQDCMGDKGGEARHYNNMIIHDPHPHNYPAKSKRFDS
jgi:hypothetical protein